MISGFWSWIYERMSLHFFQHVRAAVNLRGHCLLHAVLIYLMLELPSTGRYAQFWLGSN